MGFLDEIGLSKVFKEIKTRLGKKVNSIDMDTELAKKVDKTSLGVSNGVAQLDASGTVPASQLPSYVDDVIEGYLNGGKFYKTQTIGTDKSVKYSDEIQGENGKIYIDKATNDNKIYRYTTAGYVPISDVPEATLKEIAQLKIDVNKLVNITWSELKALRDAGNLIPGLQYRITDYNCTTTQSDTQSAGHQFDIIVTADYKNKLNEVARAIQHDGDTYFFKSKLEAWKIWYCLDNDTTRFAWADDTNGKGVIYRMIDEWNNDCPYDFKNIQFKRYKITKAKQSDLIGTYLGLKSDNAKDIETDTNNSIWCYTFTAQISIKQGDNFVIPNNAPYIDGSLESPYRHMNDDEETSTYHDNKIGSYLIVYDESEVKTLCGKYYLPNNVFIGYFESITNASNDDYCYAYCSHNITLGNDCNHNSFGNGCYSNSFGNGCYSNSFGNGCNSNSFGNGCNSNSFGNGCNSNSFGNDCYHNSFENYCNHNSFGNGCNSNSFGNYCYSNSFGNYCNSNSFGNDCNSNSFENYCNHNSFGNNCNSNSFGNNCYHNSFGNGCNSNSFGNYCYSNSFGNYCNSNSFGNNCIYNRLGVTSSGNKLDAYYQYNKFENGVQYVEFSGVGINDNSVQNYHIKQGMLFTASHKHTIIAKAGLNYELTVAKQSDGTVVEYNEADLLKTIQTSAIINSAKSNLD